MSDREKRIPLYGSIRFCVTGKKNRFYTETESSVSFDYAENKAIINNRKISGKPKQRIENIFCALLEKSGLKDVHFELESKNIGYPIGSGLASSAAGLAAATRSLYESIREIKEGFALNEKELTRIARLGSSSAVGSVVGSYSKLTVTSDDAWAERIADPDALFDLSVFIAQIKGGVESDKIHRAMESSRYKDERIKFVNKIMPLIEEAIINRDTAKFIKYTHEDTKNFHAAILDQGILTFEAKTIPIFRRIEDLRREKYNVGCSIAGGPTPIILTTSDEKEYVLSYLEEDLKETHVIECEIVG
jgi:mevalonate pyrophosphate decarboxylase